MGPVADEAVFIGLGDQGGVKGIGLGLVRDIGDFEGKRISADGVVANLGLGPAIGRVGVGQVRAGFRRAHQVHQARALLAGGVLHIITVHDGVGGAHQQVGGQLPGGFTLFIALLTQILVQHGHGARHLRRGHGGAAHVAVVIAGVIRIPGGVDVAAHAGDLRLQRQVGGGAPGGEVAHGGGGDELDGAVVAHKEGIGPLLRLLLQEESVRLGDGHAGDVGRAGVDLHVDHAGGVVVHHAGHSTLLLGQSLLVREGHAAAAGHHDDLVCNVHVRIALLIAVAVEEHEFKRLPLQGFEQAVAGTGAGVVVTDVPLVHGEVVLGDRVVVGGGHAQRGVVGAGGAHQAHVGVAGQGVPAEVVVVSVVGVVAGGDNHLDAGLLQLIKDLYHVGIVVAVAGGRAQREVGHVRTQQHAVLHGGHHDGPVSAVAGEHLHDQQLGFRGHAHHVGAVHFVGCGDAGHVGAVVAARAIVGHIR